MEGNERDDDTESRIDDQRFSGGASGVDEREPSMFSDINAVCKKNIQILRVLQVQRVIRVGITTFGVSQNGSYLPRPNILCSFRVLTEILQISNTTTLKMVLHILNISGLIIFI